MKNRKSETTEGIEIMKESKHLEKRKITSTSEYLKQVPSNKQS